MPNVWFLSLSMIIQLFNAYSDTLDISVNACIVHKMSSSTSIVWGPTLTL
jgi:hypothetical protein